MQEEDGQLILNNNNKKPPKCPLYAGVLIPDHSNLQHFKESPKIIKPSS